VPLPNLRRRIAGSSEGGAGDLRTFVQSDREAAAALLDRIRVLLIVG
jgi:hypothetical protein